MTLTWEGLLLGLLCWLERLIFPYKFPFQNLDKFLDSNPNLLISWNKVSKWPMHYSVYYIDPMWHLCRLSCEPPVNKFQLFISFRGELNRMDFSGTTGTVNARATSAQVKMYSESSVKLSTNYSFSVGRTVNILI